MTAVPRPVVPGNTPMRCALVPVPRPGSAGKW